MGRIKNSIPDNTNPIVQALHNAGFRHGRGAQGQPGFVRTFHEDVECLWVTVSLERNTVYLYNEYQCGGMIWSRDETIPEEVRHDADALIDWLDELVG